MKKTDLAGKVALVTGGASGIGKSAALALANSGAAVVINYHTRVKEAMELQDEVRSSGVKALALPADVSEESEVKRMFEEILRVMGSVDILVNNAGINLRKPLDKLTLDDWQHTLKVNLTSAFLCAQACIPGMMERKFGRIINIASVAAQTGGVIGPHYAASKAGMIGLTHSYASLLVRHGITANAIAPALIETDMLKNMDVQPTLIPVQRFGLPEEVADAVLLLATNGYINGQTLNINGGWYMS